MISDEINEKIAALDREAQAIRDRATDQVTELGKKRAKLVSLRTALTPAMETALSNLGVEVKLQP